MKHNHHSSCRSPFSGWNGILFNAVSFFCGVLLLVSSANADDKAPDSPVRIGYENWTPYLGDVSVEPGLMQILVKEAYATSGRPVEFVDIPWPLVENELMSLEIDAGVGWLFNRERAERFHFSDSLLNTTNVLFHHRDLSFSWDRLEDLSSWRIGVTRSYSYGDEFDHLLRDGRLKVSAAASDLENMERLIDGRIDIFPMDRLSGRFLLQKHFPNRRNLLKHDERVLFQSPLHLVVSRSHPNAALLLQDFNRGMRTLRRSGRYQRILQDNLTRMEVRRLRLYTENYAPYNYLDEAGKPAGLVVDVMNRLFDAMGVERRVQADDFYPWSRAYREVQRLSNAVVFAMTRTPERDQLFQWVGPLMRSDVVLLGAKSSGLAGRAPETLDDRSICVVAEDVGEQVLRTHDIARVQLHRVNTPESCASMLSLGRVDLWAYGDVAGRWYLQRAGENLDDYEETFLLEESSQYIGFNRDVPSDIVGLFQEKLDYLVLSGAISTLLTFTLH